MKNTTSVDAAALREYQERWDRINEFEEEEMHKMTPEQRWRQLNLLFQFGARMGWLQRSAEEEEIAAVHARWNKLKDAYEQSQAKANS